MMSVEYVCAQAIVLLRMWIQVQLNISFSIKTIDFCIAGKILRRENTFFKMQVVAFWGATPYS